MKKPPFVNNEIYHVYNRGVEKRDLFMDDQDHLRFIHDLFEFNDKEPAPSSNMRFSIRKPSKINATHLSQCLEVGPPNIEQKPRKLLIEILAFCLMKNHYHLLLKQKVNGGVVKFMQKLGTGYSMYFNEKNERVGPLFQGKFKAKLVKRDAHFLYLPFYIHLNPLDLKFPDWREKGIKDYKTAITFLESYRWSSYLDYTGKKNFPSITSREFLNEILGGPKKHSKEITEWIANKKTGLKDIEDVLF